MDFSILFAIIVFASSFFYILIKKGVGYGLISLSYVVIFLFSYFLTLNLWSEKGKIYLAIIFSSLAIVLGFYRHILKKNRRIPGTPYLNYGDTIPNSPGNNNDEFTGGAKNKRGRKIKE